MHDTVRARFPVGAYGDVASDLGLGVGSRLVLRIPRLFTTALKEEKTCDNIRHNTFKIPTSTLYRILVGHSFLNCNIQHINNKIV